NDIRKRTPSDLRQLPPFPTRRSSDLGVSVKDASGNVKDQETIFNESVVALQNMEDGTEKAKLANDLFGRSGAEMMPLLNGAAGRSEEHTSELQSRENLVCRLLLEKKN